jgi:hypothetical protein
MSVSGLSVLHCPFSFVYRLITHYNVVEIGETKQRDHFIAGKTSQGKEQMMVGLES